MDFWMRLKNEIKAQNTTQEWVAGKIGVPLGTFKKWLTRRTYPDLREGVEIARLLDTTAEYLITGNKGGDLNDEEQQVLAAYRKLGRVERDRAALAMNAWLAWLEQGRSR